VKDAALLSYCERVEREFFRLKGRQGTLSPSDFARASSWHRDGVPVEAALEGITDAFQAQSGGRERGVEEVNGLSFCERFVEKAVARRRGR
jgi:hypothetical protein